MRQGALYGERGMLIVGIWANEAVRRNEIAWAPPIAFFFRAIP